MNRFKIADELNEWAQKEFGSLYFVEIKDDDLMLVTSGQDVAWFDNFKANEFDFSSSLSYDLGIKLIEEDIIKKFYEKGVEVISKRETKYTVKITHSEEFYLNIDTTTDDQKIIFDELVDSCTWKNKFTQKEISELKKRDDLAIDWNKAIIRKVDDDE